MPDNSALDTLKGLLGDNAEQKIQSVLTALSSTESTQDSESTDTNLPALTKSPDNYLSAAPDTKNIESVLRIKGIIDELSAPGNDSRSNLLLSLKPFMRSTRQQSIDSAIKLLNLSKLTSLFKF